jgi:F-type H+-transporting ATPase subunit a
VKFCIAAWLAGGSVLPRIGKFVLLFVALLASDNALASGSIVNWYDVGYRAVAGENFSEHTLEQLVPIFGGLFTLCVTLVVGFLFSRSLARVGDNVAPDGRFSVQTLIEMAMDVPYGIAKDNIGDKWRTFLPLLAGTFMFILVSNLGGLIPGFIPATENLNTNLAMGLTVYLVYNIAGFREHGAHYLKQFAGPMLAIAPLMFVIELISHIFRPVSLSLRLMGNIFADHLMLGIFTSTAPHIIIPSALMFFGLLVSLVQSFVFTLLTGIYITLAVSHDH